MADARSSHAAALLPDGRVLIAGGYRNPNYLASAELYDPETGVFTSAGSMYYGRYRDTATVLPDGRVLIAGGYDGTAMLSSAELYKP